MQQAAFIRPPSSAASAMPSANVFPHSSLSSSSSSSSAAAAAAAAAARGSGSSAAQPLLGSVRAASSQLDSILERASAPIKPYAAAIGRFLLVVTFLEDSLRIVTQWSDQTWYLENHRFMHRLFARFFLSFNVVMMLVGSTLAILRKRTFLAVILLFTVVIAQAIGYGLIFDATFFMRNLAVIGGLLMLLADAYYTQSRSRAFFPGLPEISESQRTTYLQLAGRLLLVLLFASFVFGGTSNPESMEGGYGLLRIVFIVLGAAACLMVAIGFKARRSAMFLVMILSVFNVLINNWWSLHHTHPQRDFLKYDFFQTLSIMGGLILLTNIGPGNLSIDEKKKAY